MYELTADDRLLLQALYDLTASGGKATWTDLFFAYGEQGGDGSELTFCLQQLLGNGWAGQDQDSADEVDRYYLLSKERVEGELYGGLLDVAAAGGIRLRASALAERSR